MHSEVAETQAPNHHQLNELPNCVLHRVYRMEDPPSVADHVLIGIKLGAEGLRARLVGAPRPRLFNASKYAFGSTGVPDSSIRNAEALRRLGARDSNHGVARRANCRDSPTVFLTSRGRTTGSRGEVCGDRCSVVEPTIPLLRNSFVIPVSRSEPRE